MDDFLEAANAAGRSANADRHREAIGLYAGDLLPEDRYDDWAAVRREDLRGVYLDLLRRLGRVHEARAEHGPAIDALQRLVASEPAEEEAHADLIRLHALAGNRHLARRKYERLVDALRREVDAEPDAPTRRLVEEIRTGRFPSERAVHGRGNNGPPADLFLAHVSGRDDTSPAAGQSPACRPTNLPGRTSGFVGRDQEVTEARRLLSSTRLLTLVGVGKSRLALPMTMGYGWFSWLHLKNWQTRLESRTPSTTLAASRRKRVT